MAGLGFFFNDILFGAEEIEEAGGEFETIRAFRRLGGIPGGPSNRSHWHERECAGPHHRSPGTIVVRATGPQAASAKDFTVLLYPSGYRD